jgi:hypothetical protein
MSDAVAIDLDNAPIVFEKRRTTAILAVVKTR